MILIEWRHPTNTYWFVGEWIWDEVLGVVLQLATAGSDESGARKAARKAGLKISHKEVWEELPDGDMGRVE